MRPQRDEHQADPMTIDETIELILTVHTMFDSELRACGVDVIEIPQEPPGGWPADLLEKVEFCSPRILRISQNVTAVDGHWRTPAKWGTQSRTA